MGPFSPMVRLHYLAAPLILFWWFYSLSILDPMNVGWLKDNEDPFQAFLGWTAFRFSDWQWPLGLSRLVAYPNGMPLIATDSNPLVSIPLKLLSPLLPYPFQFEGWWLLISVFLSYASLSGCSEICRDALSVRCWEPLSWRLRRSSPFGGFTIPCRRSG